MLKEQSLRHFVSTSCSSLKTGPNQHFFINCLIVHRCDTSLWNCQSNTWQRISEISPVQGPQAFAQHLFPVLQRDFGGQSVRSSSGHDQGDQSWRTGSNFAVYLCWSGKCIPKLPLWTPSLISPSFQGDPTIFLKGIFLKQTPHIKN